MENKRIYFLDYIKAVCVLLVITTHYDWTWKWSPWFTLGIKMAVPIFMIISGYNFAMSYIKMGDIGLKEMYKPRLIFKKVKRFAEPFIIVCFVELAIICYQNKHINLPRLFLEGAYGPGSYYVPIMFQLIFIFPLIYALIKKKGTKGVLIVGVINLLYEASVAVFSLGFEGYRLFIGRYLFLIALGCYFLLNSNKKIPRKWYLISFIAGIIYIEFIVGNDNNLPLFIYWRGTSMPVAFYIFPVVAFCFYRFYNCQIKGVIGDILSYIGKASYHIYLFQMVYYHFELGGFLMDLPWYFAVPYNMLICVCIGSAFYSIETYIKKKHLWRTAKRLIIQQYDMLPHISIKSRHLS